MGREKEEEGRLYPALCFKKLSKTDYLVATFALGNRARNCTKNRVSPLSEDL